MVSRSDIDNFDEALAWAVQQVDRQFDGANMLKVTVEQYMRTSADPADSEWRYTWTAAVSGGFDAL